MAKRILYLGLDPTHYQHQDELIHWPIIQIIPRPLSDPPLHHALKHFHDYSHLIVTSKTTVAILKDYLHQMNIDLQTWAKKSTIAVGKVTAKHLEACGVIPSKIAREETAEGIIHELQQFPLEKAHIFWPHSSQARPLIKDFLIEQNIQHTTCVLYEPQPCINKDLPSIETFDEIVFTSPSTVKAFLQIFGEFPSQAKLIAIGPITDHCLKIFLKTRNACFRGKKQG